MRYTGVVALDELDAVREEIESHPQFRPGLDRLWDERDCDIQMSHDDLTRLATSWAATGVDHGKRKLAYLVNKGLSWGFNRVFEAYRANPKLDYQMFHDFESAKQWLALPDELDDPRNWLD